MASPRSPRLLHHLDEVVGYLVPRPRVSFLVPDPRSSFRILVPRSGSSFLIPDPCSSFRILIPRSGSSFLVLDLTYRFITKALEIYFYQNVLHVSVLKFMSKILMGSQMYPLGIRLFWLSYFRGVCHHDNQQFAYLIPLT